MSKYSLQNAAKVLTTTGSILVLCLGINLIWDKKIRVANMLPVIVIGVLIALI